MLPSIFFVQRLRARPSSLRRAPLCTGPLTRCCLGTAINHPYVCRGPVPDVQEGRVQLLRWECASPLWDDAEPLSARDRRECPSLLQRTPPFSDDGGNWVIIAEAGGKTRLVSIPSGGPHPCREPLTKREAAPPHAVCVRTGAILIFKTEALGCPESFDEARFRCKLQLLLRLLDHCLPSPQSGGL